MNYLSKIEIKKKIDLYGDNLEMGHIRTESLASHVQNI